MMRAYRIIIAGGRDFSDYTTLFTKMNKITSSMPAQDIEVVSGCAKGADSLGEMWAFANDIPIKRFPADWDRYGKRAGYIRNSLMADYATHLVAFWDCKSKGTAMMIEIAKEKGLFVRVVLS